MIVSLSAETIMRIHTENDRFTIEPETSDEVRELEQIARARCSVILQAQAFAEASGSQQSDQSHPIGAST